MPDNLRACIFSALHIGRILTSRNMQTARNTQALSNSRYTMHMRAMPTTRGYKPLSILRQCPDSTHFPTAYTGYLKKVITFDKIAAMLHDRRVLRCIVL